MGNRSELKNRLLSTLKELKREMQYRELKDYIQRQKSKSYLNGKESFILRGATSLLRRIEADRRSVLHPFCQARLVMCKDIWRFPLEWGNGDIYGTNN